MGCGCSQLPRRAANVDLYRQSDLIELENEEKRVSPPLNVNGLTEADDEDNTLPSKQEPVVDEHSKDSRVLDITKQCNKERKSEVLVFESTNPDMQIDIRESKELTHRESTILNENMTEHSSKLLEEYQRIHLERAKAVLSITSLPDPDMEISKSDEELINTKQELSRANSDNIKKDETISKLLAENSKLKEAAKRKEKSNTSSRTLQLHDKASCLRSKREAIRRSAGIASNSMNDIFFDIKTSVQSSISSEITIDELPMGNPQLDESVISFRTTLEEAKLEHAKQKSRKNKPSVTDWQFSSLITL